MELEDICCQTEETQAYRVCRLLDDQGKKAQCRQEEALREMFESGRKSNFALLSLHSLSSTSNPSIQTCPQTVIMRSYQVKQEASYSKMN